MKFLIKENKLTETIFRYLDAKKFYFEETQYEIFLSDDIISDEDPDLQIYSIIFDKIDSTCHINTDLIHEVLNFFSLDFKMSRKMITEWFISRYNKKVLGHSTI